VEGVVLKNGSGHNGHIAKTGQAYKDRNMKINEAEKLAGITRKNIRFYEKEGLLQPGRSLENGYRDYQPEDVETLKKIRLLRRLSLPLEEIRRIQTGHITLEGALERHMILLKDQSKSLDNMRSACQMLLEQGASYANVDTDAWLAEIDRLESEGMYFVDVKVQDKKTRKQGSVIAAAVFCLLMLLLAGVMLWAFFADPAGAPPWPIMAVFVAIPAVMAIAAVIALIQRCKEIEGGEEDAAAKY